MWLVNTLRRLLQVKLRNSSKVVLLTLLVLIAMAIDRLSLQKNLPCYVNESQPDICNIYEGAAVTHPMVDFPTIICDTIPTLAGLINEERSCLILLIESNNV